MFLWVINLSLDTVSMPLSLFSLFQKYEMYDSARKNHVYSIEGFYRLYFNSSLLHKAKKLFSNRNYSHKEFIALSETTQCQMEKNN